MTGSKLSVRRLALASIAVAFAVMGLKFIAWWLTGAVALYSDALESIVNVVASVAAFMAIRWAQLPADAEHPFGHHKAEYFSAVLEGILIAIAALLIIHEAANKLMEGVTAMESPAQGLAVNLGATAINGFWAWLLLKTGREAKSPALSADGKHILSDVVTSVGVFIGLVAALLTGWLWLDPALAILVALNILREGWHVISESIDALMDRAAPDAVSKAIDETILAHAQGAIEVHDIRTRVAGPATFIEFHLIVDAAMTVDQSHVICDRLEHALRDQVPGARISIHVEPDHKAKDEGLVITG